MMRLSAICHHAIDFSLQPLPVFIGRIRKAVQQNLTSKGNKGNCHTGSISVGRNIPLRIVLLFTQLQKTVCIIVGIGDSI